MPMMSRWSTMFRIRQHAFDAQVVIQIRPFDGRTAAGKRIGDYLPKRSRLQTRIPLPRPESTRSRNPPCLSVWQLSDGNRSSRTE